MVYKKGSQGQMVKNIQELLGLTPDGIFGDRTEAAVRQWQVNNSLGNDGIVGNETLQSMGLLSTGVDEMSESLGNLHVNRHYLPSNEYMTGSNPEYIFIHHTAGWHNPYQVVDAWGRDNRGKIATEFVLGGPSIKGNDDSHDGELVQATPQGGWGWHLGTGASYMHRNSVGIEVCNFGYVTEGGYYKWTGSKNVWVDKKDGEFYNYVGTVVDGLQVVELNEPFRGHKFWHRYSDRQIEVLRDWIIAIGERDFIDIREGLPKWIKNEGAKAFEFKPEALQGKVKGLLTHTNVRKDKFDMFPQQELLDMLMSL